MQPDQPSSLSSTLPPVAKPTEGGKAASVCSDSTIEVTKGQDVAVRMYGRKKTGQASPVVVHFHGGAFTSGGLDNGCTVASLLEGVGAVVVSVAYPLTPCPQPVDTGSGVLQWAYRTRARLAGQVRQRQAARPLCTAQPGLVWLTSQPMVSRPLQL